MYDVIVCVFDYIWLEMFTHSNGDYFSLKSVSSKDAGITMGTINQGKN